MLENILLDIVLLLVKAGEYFVGYYHAISDCWRLFLLAIGMPFIKAGEYFDGYFHASSECWKIYCWLISCH